MNLSSVATALGGATQLATAIWTVSSPVARGYQTVLYLRFNTQSATEGVEVDESGCHFEASFQNLDYNALSAAPIPAAQLSMSKDGKAVIVKLDGPRQVLSVSLSSGKPIELHRADGTVQADKAADSSGFTDVNFGVQPVDASSIAANQLTSVNVRGTPSNPRIGLAAPDLKSPAMFWPTADAAGQTAVHTGAAFGKALQTLLAAQWSQALAAHQQNPASAPLPDYLDAALVLQSDAPCLVSISQFNVTFHRLLASFPSGSGKQVLRYAGKMVERQSVSIQLPASATVASATLRINESFHPGGAAVTGADLLASGSIAQDRGIRISASSAQRASPSNSVAAAGIALGLVALEPGTQLAVELQPDQNSLPTGKKLTAASISLDRVGQLQWAVASFQTPVALPGQPFWILVSVQRGSAVWLVAPGSEPARLLEKSNALWTEVARVDGLQAMNRVLSPAMPANLQPPARTHLSIGMSELAGALQADGSRLFNAASQINAFLLAHNQSPQAVTIPLVFTTGAAGQITVYPPHITYDV
jgi:hypothetical protein